MPYELFWYGDVFAARAYIRAFRRKQEIENSHAYLQGAYVYDAILRASPILHDFVKKGTQPMPWRSEPFKIGVQRYGGGNVGAENNDSAKIFNYMNRLAESTKYNKNNAKG